ncbi:lactococcin 972 family bacteriocin [Nocardioides convexus]|uniref:lactococcin 972 family bacteriocin n=1 Tax=Nocardioides convexus TaxID=2712224 RepID=UPI002418955A|nr:lactococcin 972 family bacteriocin [Nocardioides convexus]
MNKIKMTVAAGAMMLTAVGAASPAMAYLHPGSVTQHPSTGGTWEYGFWNAKVRSYYTVNKNHGSSVGSQRRPVAQRLHRFRLEVDRREVRRQHPRCRRQVLLPHLLTAPASRRRRTRSIPGRPALSSATGGVTS